MAQNIDIQYREKATSQPLNQRFKDITGTSVLRGFRLTRGSGNFSISLMRGGFTSSVAITPSGTRVEETTDLIDEITILPNTSPGGLPRVDAIYLVYAFGSENAIATYEVVQGSTIAPVNPNKNTHLLLGWVNVKPSSAPVSNNDIISVAYGFSELKVAGDATVKGDLSVSGNVSFKGNVTFEGGVGGDTEGNQSYIERLATPIITSADQTLITLPAGKTYTMNTNSLFVFIDGEMASRDKWQEVSSNSFRFFDPQPSGKKIDAYWFKSIGINNYAEHEHDEHYYRKWEVSNRLVRYATDFFAGNAGRVVSHYLGTENYIVVSVIPVEKTPDVGVISVQKNVNEIIVYNTGTYRGAFDITYQIKGPFDGIPENALWMEGEFTIESENYNTGAARYATVIYRRKNNTIYMRSTLHTLNATNQYTRLRVEYFNSSGLNVVRTREYALSYDGNGTLIRKSIIA